MIADRLKLLASPYVEEEIEGETLRFYSCGVRTSARLADLIAELSGHASVLLTSAKADQGQLIEDFDDKASGQTITKTSVQPIDPTLAEMRVKQRQRAIQGALNALLNPNYRMALAEMLADSLRDDFPRDKPRNMKELGEWVDGMDVPVFAQFMKGMFRANAKIIGDLGNLWGGALSSQLKAAVDQVKEGVTGGSPSKTV